MENIIVNAQTSLLARSLWVRDTSTYFRLSPKRFDLVESYTRTILLLLRSACKPRGWCTKIWIANKMEAFHWELSGIKRYLWKAAILFCINPNFKSKSGFENAVQPLHQCRFVKFSPTPNCFGENYCKRANLAAGAFSTSAYCGLSPKPFDLRKSHRRQTLLFLNSSCKTRRRRIKTLTVNKMLGVFKQKRLLVASLCYVSRYNYENFQK